MIKHRQKVIQLADSSDRGWRVVKEYEKIPKASDSDDEKNVRSRGKGVSEDQER